MSEKYVPRHAAPVSTQEAHPWRSAVRTGVEVLLALVPVLLVGVPLVIEHLGPWLPESWAAWLVAAVAFLTAVSTLLARLAAARPVVKFVRDWLPWLAPDA